jgi:peroxiredoxin
LGALLVLLAAASEGRAGNAPVPRALLQDRIIAGSCWDYIASSDYLEFALASSAGAGAGTPEPAPSHADEFRAIVKAFADQQQQIVQTFREAKTQDEKRRAWAEYRKGGRDYAPRVLRLAEKDPRQPFVPEALAWIVTNARDTPEAEKAVALLIRDPAGSQRLASACDALADARSANAERLLRAVADQCADREVRGRVSFALGIHFMRLAEPTGEYRLADVEENNAKAVAYFEAVIARYGELKHWQGTLGKAASRNLDEIRGRSIGKVIPEVQGVDVDGNKIKLSDYRGKVMFLDFWGTWCPPCMLMVPHERALMRRMEGRPFTILGVNADKDRATYRKVCRRAGITWPCLFEGDVGGPIARQFNLYNYPTAYLIDHQGVIRRKYREPPDEGELDRAVDQLVKAAERAGK